MTLLFLGEALGNPNVAKIVDKVAKEARWLEPFNILVDHRGTLGPDEADVLFFGPNTPWEVHDFRSMLLGQQEIAAAHNSVPQRQVWTPHLTLGYPETPAHPDDWDPMGQQYVQFDKVAVWYGDSEGSEFLLTTNPKPRESEMDVAWSDKVADALAHYGVKGMRWGIRRKNVGSADEKIVSTDAAKAAGAAAKAKQHGSQSLSNQEMQALVQRMNLERQLKQVTPDSRAKKGGKFVASLLVNAGKQQAQLAVNDVVGKQVKKALIGK